ncbi:hypothetical protein [Corynebacterium pacaense]|uniref:hypothetical protein n=1 Tax=Corynebacterium pacaense TaxID=1816684 RepID=UPI0015C46292|nr:hypothetical protein [Corynebacterium pacaense]
MVVAPTPRDPGAPTVSAEDVERRVNEVLARSADSLRDEAENLEAAYRILNDALQ